MLGRRAIRSVAKSRRIRRPDLGARAPPLPMKPPGIHLRYAFEATEQSGAGIEHPLFDTLAALQAHGSITHAAQALGLSYRHVWGALRTWEAELGQPLVHWVRGTRAQLTPYALRLMWAERQARTRMRPHLEALRAELRHVLAVAETPGIEVIDMLASHDLGLPHLQGLAARGGLHLSLTFAGSAEALRGLAEGRCQLAGFHAPHLPEGSTVFAEALRPLLRPGEHKLIGSHSRRQGLMYLPGAAGNPTLRGLAEGRWRFVSRQPGSGTRLLLEHLMHEAGLPLAGVDGVDQRIEHTHVAVAAAVAAGTGDVGLGLEAAAREFGLAFVPLADEDYYFVCLKPALENPAVMRLRTLLGTPRWAGALQALPGYQAQRAGEVLSLTRALPWWEFKRKRRRRATPAASPMG